MKLAELLTEDLISATLKGISKKNVIHDLVDLLFKKGLVKNKERALEDILIREQHLSTGMENGLAIPHAKSDTVDRLVVAFGIHNDGIDFDSLDGKAAHFIFLVMSPRDTSGPHIQALAGISRFIKSDQVRKNLKNAQSRQDIFSIFCKA